MLRFLVPPQIDLPLETLPAHVAPERLEASVFATMGDEIGALAECLPTHLAFVWLFTCGNKVRRQSLFVF